MNKDCNCQEWENNYPQLSAVLLLAKIHALGYSGLPFVFCPWCGKKLEDWVEDDFGSAVSAYCPECKEPTMQVVRPGKFQCSNCG